MVGEQAPAGWYDDPENPGKQRYWDGQAWAPLNPPPPPAAAAPPEPLPPAPGTNGFAVASLVLGVLWLWWLGSILAIVFGHIAKSQLAQPDNAQTGSGLATAGLVLGYIGLAGVVLLIVLVAASA